MLDWRYGPGQHPFVAALWWALPFQLKEFFFSREYLELDTNLHPEKVHEATDVFITQINSTVTELKRLFLVEDLIDSVKVDGQIWFTIVTTEGSVYWFLHL